MNIFQRSVTPYILLMLSLVAVFLVYQPGLSGPYIFDDAPNITKNHAIQIENLSVDSLKTAALSSVSGPLRRPVSMLSFALNYYFTGFHPFYFKITNLAIHMLSGLGIFALTLQLLGTYRKRHQPNLSETQLRWLSLVITSFWLLHPFNLTSVLYTVQRMTSLSALFCIYGLVLYIYGRERLDKTVSGALCILASVAVFTPLAALSKENGILLPFFMLVIEVTLFQFQTPNTLARRFLIGFFVVFAALPVIAAIAYIASNPTWLLAGYIGRDFTLVERVMTEARVLFFYIGQIILPRISQMGLFHDDIPISHSLLAPMTTLFCLLGILGLLILAVVLRKKTPLISFGILFFFAGHVFESTIFPFEIAHEHRNYLPMYGLIVIVIYYLLQPIQHVKTIRLRQVVAGLMLVLFAFSTFVRAENWANPYNFALSEVAHHPNSARNNDEIAVFFMHFKTDDPEANEKNYQSARYYFEKANSLDTTYLNGLYGLIISSSMRGKEVEAAWISSLIDRIEHAPAAASIGDKLNELLECQYKKICALNMHDIETLLQAALRNPTLNEGKLSSILDAKIYYLVNIAVDYTSAITTMKQKIALAPQELQYRLTFVQFLTAIQHHEEARTELRALKKMDAKGSFTKAISDQEQEIFAQENSK